MPKLLTQYDDIVINLYTKNRLSMRKIAQQLCINPATVKKILLRHNIVVRTHQQIFNEHYFDKIDSHNKAYLLGFLYADGCINQNNVVSFSIHQDDKEILEMYVSELKATNEITYIQNKPHVRISFCSKHMCDTLINMGCGHNKTTSLSFPNIPEVYKYDFIRGFMDGDGCICLINRGTHKYISLSFTGTLEMMQELKSIFNVDNKITFYRNSYALHIGKELDVLRILYNIYNNAELYMTRKFNKYKAYCEYVQKKEDELCQEPNSLCS